MYVCMSACVRCCVILHAGLDADQNRGGYAETQRPSTPRGLRTDPSPRRCSHSVQHFVLASPFSQFVPEDICIFLLRI